MALENMPSEMRPALMPDTLDLGLVTSQQFRDGRVVIVTRRDDDGQPEAAVTIDLARDFDTGIINQFVGVVRDSRVVGGMSATDVKRVLDSSGYIDEVIATVAEISKQIEELEKEKAEVVQPSEEVEDGEFNPPSENTYVDTRISQLQCDLSFARFRALFQVKDKDDNDVADMWAVLPTWEKAAIIEGAGERVAGFQALEGQQARELEEKVGTFQTEMARATSGATDLGGSVSLTAIEYNQNQEDQILARAENPTISTLQFTYDDSGLEPKEYPGTTSIPAGTDRGYTVTISYTIPDGHQLTPEARSDLLAYANA